MKKADNGNRTRLSGLGSRRSTDEPYLHGNHYSTLTLKYSNITYSAVSVAQQ